MTSSSRWTSDPARVVGEWPVTVRRHARAKYMRLRLDARNGTVLLTIPPRVSERRALAWAERQKEWIEAAVASVAPASALGPGSVVPLYGQDHILSWQAGASRAVRLEPGRLVVGGPVELLAPRLLRWLRAHAAQLLERETREYAATADVQVSRIGVGDPVSRWGSCSAEGSIRYSWRLILAPDWVRRATVAHEVAHRIHMDHSPAFHALVARLLGADPKPAGRWLRRHGASLQRFGRF
jgi:predicted metal-dependent hydrolase